jgi:uncharacterized protein YaiL (DUF2058 family)
MADSLQDQLRALGLARDKPNRSGGKKPKQPSRRQSRPQGKHSLSLEKAFALKEREEKQQADQARRKKQAEDRKRRELNNQIRTLTEKNRLNRDDADIARNFMFKGRIRKMYVTSEQQLALNRGELGVVYLSGSYHLMASEHVEAVRRLSEEHVPDLSGVEEDDGDYPVPDDLIW